MVGIVADGVTDMIVDLVDQIGYVKRSIVMSKLT
jgi:hypothetical protein